MKITENQEIRNLRTEVKKLHELRKAASASALPPSEPHGACERSRLATCSLPVSLVAAAALSLRVLARSAADARDGEMAMRLSDALSGCAEMARRTERQPEENAPGEPQPRA